jgi:SAM-dependent methyltransferase
MVADVAATVVGVDRDAAAIDTAQAVAGQEDVTFVTAEALGYLRALAPADVDVILCFEGIEHLHDVELVAAELVRLVEGGVGMIVSVPNSATFEEENEFHVTDFDLDSVNALFAEVPGAVVAYQTHAEGSLISGRATRSVSAEVAVEGEQDLDWANHFLVLAGVDDEALLSSSHAALQLAVAPVSNRYMRNLEQANRALWGANGRLSRERLGRGAAGAAPALVRQEAQAEVEAEGVRHQREEEQRAWVAVSSSRLTNWAARIAGHRFERT